MANQQHIPNKPSDEVLQALKEAFLYDPDTGEVRHNLNRPRNHFISDHGYRCWLTKATKRPEAGYINSQGRVQICFSHVSLERNIIYYRYHITWFLHYGEWPHSSVDHINQIRSDDRISNLRCVSHYENMHNMSNQSALGIGVHTSGNGYSAQIRHNGVNYYLGSFPKPSHGRIAYDIGYLLVEPTALAGPNGLKRKDLDRAVTIISPRLRLEKLLAALEDNHNPSLPIAA